MDSYHFLLNIQKPGCFRCLLVTWFCLTLNSSATRDVKMLPIRDTVYGKIQGYVHHLKDGKEVERYLGIPFAAPPIGNRRFELPDPPERWSHTRETIHAPAACMQHLLNEAYIREHAPDYDGRMSEDCLYLNVYVPRSNGSSLAGLPVLIHVHGGSNEAGMGAMLHGDILASYGGIIVVTLNYRLGAFGFLRVPQLNIPGNFGLHDQVMAFRWVNENIANFGGDASKVTIQGHSAGSIDVALHVLSPLSRGLYRYAILQSGAPLAYWSIMPDGPPDERSKGALHHLRDLDCYFRERRETLSCLQSINASRISTKIYNHGDDIFIFSPSVDGTLVVEHPKDLLVKISLGVKGLLNVESLMTGVVRDEGSLTAQLMVRNEKPKRYEDFDDEYSHSDTLETFDDQMFRSFPVTITNLYRKVDNFRELSHFLYKPWADPRNATAAYMALSDLVGDTTFTAPAMQMADYLSTGNATELYVYRFEHRSKGMIIPEWMGVPHGEDLFYLFGCPFESRQTRNYTALDKRVSIAVMDIWANFVKHGRPYLSHEPSTLRAYGEEKSYVSITSTETDVVISNKQRMRARFMAYWNYLLPFLGTKSTAGASDGSGKDIILWTLAAALCVTVLLSLVVLMFVCYNYKTKMLATKSSRSGE